MSGRFLRLGTESVGEREGDDVFVFGVGFIDLTGELRVCVSTFFLMKHDVHVHISFW